MNKKIINIGQLQNIQQYWIVDLIFVCDNREVVGIAIWKTNSKQDQKINADINGIDPFEYQTCDENVIKK